ncbi:MAG: hypothetical protein Q4B50_07180 [Bacillota bacterium]|nr:hypothetical protein [Bacillota bacterium]
MTQALLIGAFSAGIYGLFLFIRGLIRLKKINETKMFFCCLALFLLGCLFLGGGLLIKLEALNIWIVFPMLVILFFLLSAGYFLEAYLKGELRRRMDGLAKTIPARPKNWLRNLLLFLIPGLLIWIFGCFIGFGEHVSLETVFLCLSLFLVGRALAWLWKYRGF